MSLNKLWFLPFTEFTLPPSLRVTSPARVTTISILAVIGLIVYYRRWKDKRKNKSRKEESREQNESSYKSSYSNSPNGDVLMGRLRRADSPSGSSNRSLSLLRTKSLSGSTSSLGAVSTTSTITHPVVDTTNYGPVQLCSLGFETLQLSVKYWEDAMVKLQSPDDSSIPTAILDPDNIALHNQLDKLLENAYRLIDSYEHQCERQSDRVAFDTAIAAFTEVDRMSERRSLDATSSSDQESFVSATDMANLSDLETHREMFHHLPLYEAGLLELKHGSITCRTLRTEMTQCMSDTEFLAKLHCIRLALDVVFQNQENRRYFHQMGQQILGSFLIKADRDADDFNQAFANMMDFVGDVGNWGTIEEELRGRGVKCFSFYDIVLDFILMDAFDDLANPPSSVITVVQNRWLSNGFKETALATAVWSVLKAKRRLLKFSDGFISKFYSITEHTSPVLAWGFLGPESELKDLCYCFKDLVLGLIRDIFSFEKSRYTTVEALGEDIVKSTRQRMEDASKLLA
ncbi:mitoguardin 2-like [Mizuhopecten yessoensis]|uniref:Protein FAM73B n=1 Tax=Mizuhopecten yessoensis TaxID=6573 RepID=A0A210QME0_MIZYE|nr:mitoguardin 2-like [Mizuhopecten yessoensis]OWF49902.1 Protein FAM73B [Mizuhopecten yessoensis]